MPRLGELSQTLEELANQHAPLSSVQLSHARELCARHTVKVNECIRHPKFGSWTPLHIAIARGHTQLIQVLLDNRADVTARTGNGYSVMQGAAKKGHFETVRLLLLHDAETLPTDTWPWLTRDGSPVPSVINEPDHGVELEYEKAHCSLCHAHYEPSTTRDSSSLTRGPVRLRRSRKASV